MFNKPMKKLVYISAQPTDIYFAWQVGLWLESIEKVDNEATVHVLIYMFKGGQLPQEWHELQKLYPKVLFEVYEDDSMKNLFHIYEPLTRPLVLSKHFAKYPELEKQAILYCDSDILFTKKPDVEQYLQDDVNYLSDTVSYIGAEYLVGKSKDVLKNRQKEFEKRDVLGEMCKLVGVPRELVVANQENSGGAQYLLKNVDSKFWSKVLNDCIVLKVHLDNVNMQFFASKDAGYQSWCADMWAVFYNLLATGAAVRVIKEMDFAWSTDHIGRLNEVSILHNAGVTGESVIRTRKKDENGKNILVDAPAFYKGKFRLGNNPYNNMDYLNKIINNEVSKEFCTWYYTNFIVQNKEKINKIFDYVSK